MTDDDPVLRALVDELREAAAMEIVWRPASVFAFAAMVQLALRHPGLPPSSRDLAAKFLAAVRLHFADYPTVLDVIERGDDPSEDR